MWNIKHVDFQDTFILCQFKLFTPLKVCNFADFRLILTQI